MNKSKKIGSICFISAFILNFIAIILLLIPFVLQKENSVFTYIGLGIYLVVAVLVIVGAYVLIKDKKE